MKKKILVIDVGGRHVKLMISRTERRKFKSGAGMTPREMVSQIKPLIAGWKFDFVSMGFPSPVVNGRIASEPKHLGKGWIGFNFEKALGKPVKVINDAAMQAIGSYRGGRMLFLGLGTGLGVTLIIDGVVEPTELGHLPYKRGRTFEDYVGESGRERLGTRKWRKKVNDVIERLKVAFEVDYVVLSGGNAVRLKSPPQGVRLGDNRNAFTGGLRLWHQGNGPLRLCGGGAAVRR